MKVVLYVNDNFVREYAALSSFRLTINDTYYARDESGIVGALRYNGTRNGSAKFMQLKTLFFHNDQKGSVAVITNSTGNILEQTFYDPFGNILAGRNNTFGTKPMRTCK